jgi:hypothetical protein
VPTSWSRGGGCEKLAITVPNGENWLVKGARLALIASAAVANRLPYVSYMLEPNDSIVWQGSVPAVITAGQTALIAFSTRGADGNQAGAAPTIFQKIVIPEIWLPGGANISVGGMNLQAADQFAGISLAVEKRA